MLGLGWIGGLRVGWGGVLCLKNSAVKAKGLHGTVTLYHLYSVYRYPSIVSSLT